MIIKIPAATVTCSTSIYAAGDLLGTKLTLSNVWTYGGDQPVLDSIVLTDIDKQSSALVVILFDADPSGTTFTDNSALAVADADLPKFIGHVAVATTDWLALSDSSAATVKNINLPVRPASGADLYACIAIGGTSTPTYASGNAIGIDFGFIQK